VNLLPACQSCFIRLEEFENLLESVGLDCFTEFSDAIAEVRENGITTPELPNQQLILSNYFATLVPKQAALWGYL
jgi:hypothetical protein